MHQISAERTHSTKEKREVRMTATAGVMDNPLHITGISLSSIKNHTRLSRGFQRIRRMIGLRAKTLIRILLTKWWNSGLFWYERELLEILLKSCKTILPEYYLLRDLRNENLADQVKEFYFHEYQQGWFPNLSKLIYLDYQFRAVSGLRRVKLFFLHAFESRGPEQSGRPRFKKPRIRGYRDGKGKPMDQSRKDVILANQFFYNLIDRFFDENVDIMNLECKRIE